MEVACAVLKAWKSEGHRALLFAQTNQMLNLIESMIKKEKFNFRRIDGTVSMQHRHSVLEEFTKDQVHHLSFMTSYLVNS